MSRTLIAAALGALALAGPAAADPAATGVVELRQYRMVPGGRDGFVALFDREFVDSQEVLGTRMVGQFRDLDDPRRFVWIRAWPDMAARLKGLDGFYSGDFWKARRNQANSFIDDSDNVLLLRPATPGHGFAATTKPAKDGLVVATIYYLWKDPTEGFAATFDAELRPQLEAAGLPVVAALMPEPTPNNYPRLPVRQGEHLFVWFTRVDSPQAYAAATKRLAASAGWRAVQPNLTGAQERAPQVLRLIPTPRSNLR